MTSPKPVRDAVILSAVRTAIARENGSLKDVPPEDLAAVVMKEAVARAGVSQPKSIDEVIFGHCLGAPGCLGRMALLKAGLPDCLPAITIDRQCGSGSTAVNLAAALVWAGAGDLYLAGGAESMTQMPYMLAKPSAAYQRAAPRFFEPRPLSPKEVGDPPMGITAENVAERWQIDRREQDEFGALSQFKAARALSEGRFVGQIAPVVIPQRKGDPIIFSVDEHPRPGVTVEAIGQAAPGLQGRRHGDGRELVRHQRWRRRAGRGIAPAGRGVGHGAAGHGEGLCLGRGGPKHHGYWPCAGDAKGVGSAGAAY